MSEDDLIEASPCKLRNGNWGCKTQQPVDIGDTVRIVTRAKKQWRAQITQIVWTDDQVCICETASENSPSAPAQSTSKGKTESVPKPTARDAKVTEDPAAYGGTPAYSADIPPTAQDAPTEELDAMADRAAEQADEYDDLMHAFQEFEQDKP
ncbi:hypothetical protein V5738_01010 [Salinisphaera sp. SPP-AMP-43]|uniref:hypothetical protein n=1 Tax=Salinisphaera sp. SPP-AMP-43 TaxID=3121288 RepID=UPI003C6E7E60